MAARADVLNVAIPQIQKMEGFAKLLPNGNVQAYPDPLSGAEPWTIAWGSTGAGIGPTTIWTPQQAQADFTHRLNAICDYFDSQIPWWESMDAIRAAVIPNMGWNLGQDFIHSWPHFIGCCRAGDWAGAKYNMLNPPTWLNQVHGRATILAKQMLTGVVA